MNNIVLILPNTLFKEPGIIDSSSTVYIVEHPVFFTMYNYHKLKLVLHRATMKSYESYLKKKFRCSIKYTEFNKSINTVFSKNKNKTIDMYDPVDHFVMNDLKKLAKRNNVSLSIKETPGFLTSMADLATYNEKNKKLMHANFYRWQRIHHKILVDKNNKPLGNKWSFDTMNRLPFPKNFNNYKPRSLSNNYINEAKRYIAKHFENNPGESEDINFYLPVDHVGAEKHFSTFIKSRLRCFGPYQDAVDKDIPFGCHSVLSPLMNVGLITPKYVVEKLEKYRVKHKIPNESLEGYIRQIIGWREYCRLVYMFRRKELTNKNHFNSTNKLDQDVWYYGEGSTGMLPIDDLIQKTIKYGYLHHIERLMYIGNYCLINKVKPSSP